MASAPGIEARKCVCNLDMIEKNGVYMCIAADGIQPQQTEVDPETGLNYPRVPSPWDKAHEEDWDLKVRQWYLERGAGGAA